jgi:hypothetical protein
MLTLTKKTWKYIFYAVLALVLLYVIFGSTRERFTSVNPLPTQADYAAFAQLVEKLKPEFVSKPNSEAQFVAAILKSAPESFRAPNRFFRANIFPLLPYAVVKNNTKPDGSDNFDNFIYFAMDVYKETIILPLAYAVKQQSSPPTLSAFIDMVVKIAKDGNPNMKIDAEAQGLIDQAKKGETTIQMPNGDTLPNPGYWGYKYIYGDPKAAPSGPPPSSSSSTSSKTSSGSIGGKCTPSLQQVPGGITETRCFN